MDAHGLVQWFYISPVIEPTEAAQEVMYIIMSGGRREGGGRDRSTY
jgi:hypothetical protein